ncbi:hypothetical protein PQX77_001591 [Marasmius sp. AFHP31]|nr:hypothetical protein PQX77_001591 [Marasmius sp. AFHP31]
MSDLAASERRIKCEFEVPHVRATDLERATVEARHRGEELTRDLNSPENFSSAIFGLPEEILIIVFEHLVEADVGGHTMSRKAGPWVVAQTCRRWRHLALSTPSLWTLIRINTLLLPRQPMTMLRLWLERSQALPLSCLLLLHHHPSTPDVENDILQLVMENSYRWRHLDVDLKFRHDLYSRIVSTGDLRLPVLQSLRILVNFALGAANNQPDPETSLPSAATWTAPALTGASLLIFAPSSFESIPILPWSQLTELAISFATSTSFNEIMTSLTRLERCHLHLGSQFIVAGQAVRLAPSLRRLEVAGPLSSVVNGLSCLVCNGLVELGLNPPGISTLPHLTARRLLESISHFQDRSSCQLQQLRIPITLFSFPESARVADSLSTVQALHLRVEHRTGAREAIWTIKTSDIFPNLKELYLIVYKDGIGPGEFFASLLFEIVDMVEARRALPAGSSQCTQLQCLEIDTIKYGGRPNTSLPVNQEVAERLSTLERDGLILLGRVADGEWRPQHPATSHWDLEANTRRWARFGHCNWLVD